MRSGALCGDRRTVGFALLLAIAGCRSAARPLTDASQSPAPAGSAAAEAIPVGTYTGTLPCADCSGIRTTLTLSAQSQLQTGGGTFHLSEEYLAAGNGNQRFDTQGRWLLLRGTPADRDATVYQLTSDGAERVMFFLRVGDQALRLLDRNQREIPSTANYTLTRMTAAPLGRYSPVDTADADVRVAAEYAVSEQRARAGTHVVLRRIAGAERQVVAGLNFRLCLEVTVADARAEVQVIVYRNLQQRFSLVQWSSAQCAKR